MPSPIGHALGGALIALVSERHAPNRSALWRSRPVWLCMAAACLPDVDFLWGRHNMETHSVGFALLVGAGVWAWQRSGRLAVACALAACTHVFFDWLGSDDVAPIGVMALWPFTRDFYFADVWLFDPISRQYWRDHFIPHNIRAVAKEVLLIGIPVLALAWWRTRSPRAR